MEIINLGNRIMNTYLIRTENCSILVDTGYPEQFSGFCNKLVSRNLSLNKIEYVFLTHAHDDHAGFLNDILQHTNAKVIMHYKAIEGLRRGQNSFDGGCSGKLALLTFWRICSITADISEPSVFAAMTIRRRLFSRPI